MESARRVVAILGAGGTLGTLTGFASVSGTGTGTGAVDRRVDWPQCGQGIVSPTRLAGNSRCPPQVVHVHLAKGSSLGPPLAVGTGCARAGPAFLAVLTTE